MLRFKPARQKMLRDYIIATYEQFMCAIHSPLSHSPKHPQLLWPAYPATALSRDTRLKLELRKATHMSWESRPKAQNVEQTASEQLCSAVHPYEGGNWNFIILVGSINQYLSWHRQCKGLLGWDCKGEWYFGRAGQRKTFCYRLRFKRILLRTRMSWNLMLMRQYVMLPQKLEMPVQMAWIWTKDG